AWPTTLVGSEGGIAGRRRGGGPPVRCVTRRGTERAPRPRVRRGERARPNRAATRERTTVRAPRCDVGPRSVSSALGEPPPRLPVVMAVPLTLGRGHEARANGARTSCLLPPDARAPPGSPSRAALWPSFATSAQECSASTREVVVRPSLLRRDR